MVSLPSLAEPWVDGQCVDETGCSGMIELPILKLGNALSLLIDHSFMPD
jgi:hypothetical protein